MRRNRWWLMGRQNNLARLALASEILVHPFSRHNTNIKNKAQGDNGRKENRKRVVAQIAWTGAEEMSRSHRSCCLGKDKSEPTKQKKRKQQQQ
ncbi:hypothetical protein BST61_g6244 [Cercospora zeina]